MEISWLSELEIDYPTFDYEYQMSPLDYTNIEELNFHPFSNSQSYSTNNQDLNFHTTQNFSPASIATSDSGIERPAKQLKANGWNSCTTDQKTPRASPSSLPHMISFEKSSTSPPSTSQHFYGLNSTVMPKIEVGSNGNVNCPSNLIPQAPFEDQYGSAYHGQSAKNGGAMNRSPSGAQDHVISERKRREKLSQLFIALSKFVPGLKKMDKASVLGDAVKHLKHLQERVKTLEEQATKRTVESVVFVKKSQVYADDESSSTDESSDGCCQPLSEIETRVSDKDVLIRIHCEKQKGCLSKILREVEKLHLNVISSGVLPFGNSTLDVTVVARMDVDFNLTVKDLARNLRQALRM